MKADEKLLICRAALIFCGYGDDQQSNTEQLQDYFSQIHLSLKYNNGFLSLEIADNNFNTMEIEQIQQSPKIAKISKTALQFRQLIDSLRKKELPQRLPNVSTPIINNHKELQGAEESTVIASQNKTVSQSNNFLILNESQTTLKSKPKIEVGDRDKLKKKAFMFDSNPQMQANDGKIAEDAKEDSFFQIADKKQRDSLMPSISPLKNVSTQYEQNEQYHQHVQFPSMLTPRSEVRVGQIIKQNVKNEPSKQIKEQVNQKIKNIDERIVIEHCQKQKKITEKSMPTQIFNFFANLCLACRIVIKSPHIKKYKNCIYFGYTIEKDLTYEGFLYFYDGKIYYGEFYNGYKHGLGVEINLNENVKMKGEFKEGHKTGKFYIEKPSEKYIGYLQNGIYHGEGRLTTQDYVYEGLFESGQKNGYGEQYYPKTGVRMTGTFRKGVLQKTRGSKSIPEIRSKSKISSSKDKERLEIVRKKSLQKHNQRMNKLKEKGARQSQYEIQFDTNDQYYQPPKIQFNASKLEMYRQPPQKLPKICQQFEYSFESGNNYESINSVNVGVPEGIHRGIKYRRPMNAGSMCERMQTRQLQQPLPAPCMSVMRVHR